MTYIYIVLSIAVCFAFVKLAKVIGGRIRKEAVIFLFLLAIALCGAFHYRVFMKGAVGPFTFEIGPLLDISSLLLLIYIVVVPIGVLRKAIVKNENKLSK